MGLLFSFLSTFFASAKDLVSKKLASNLDGNTSTFASFAFALPYYAVLLLVLWLLGEETFIWTLPFWVLVFLRAVTDTFAEGMKMHALGHGDLSVVAMAFSISPVFLLITSPLITGDIPSVWGTLALLLVVAGSLLMVYRPSAAHFQGQQKAILLAVIGSFFFSLNSCFDRLAVQKGTPVFSGFTMTLLSALFLLPFVLTHRDRRQALRDYQAGLWLRGLLEIAFMVCKLYALKDHQAPYVAGIMRLSLVLSVLGGRLFFKEPDFLRRLGACLLIVVGAVVIAWLEWPGPSAAEPETP